MVEKPVPRMDERDQLVLMESFYISCEFDTYCTASKHSHLVGFLKLALHILNS